MFERNSHCSCCGTRFPEGLAYPRTCAHCERITYRNPVPVAVLVVPMGDGVLTIRRGIEPRRGKLALPGGFIEIPETWQAAAAREVREETGLHVDVDSIEGLTTLSAPDGVVLIFGRSAPLPESAIAGFRPTSETSELCIVREPIELAFPLHSRVLRDYFATRGAPGQPGR